MELALTPKLDGRIKYRLDDFKELKGITKACVLFGSYIELNKQPNDLDVLFVLEKNNYKKYKTKLAGIQGIVPAKIHDVVQTLEDLKNNLLKKDNVILEILRKGELLWGREIILEVIKDAYPK